MKIQNEHKKIAIWFLKLAAIVLTTLFSVMCFVFWFQGFSWQNWLIPLLVVLLLLNALWCIRLNWFMMAKYILVLVPSYAFLLISLQTKSDGVFSNTFTYLTPKLFVIIYLMAPIVFFGIQQKKQMIISFLLLVPPVVLFDYFHQILNVYINNLPNDYDFYHLFVGIITLVYSVALLSMILYQKTTSIFKITIRQQKEEILEEKHEIEALNQNLRFQANLYIILDISSKHHTIDRMLDAVLTEVLAVNANTLENKGAIVLMDAVGSQSIVSQIGLEANQLNSSDAISYILCDKKALKIPIEEDEILGYLILFLLDDGEVEHTLSQYLFAVASILAQAIVLNRTTAHLKMKNGALAKQEQLLRATLEELEESIDYAFIIQDALLPSHDKLRQTVGDCSVLFLPRNKVSGDFYYVHDIGSSVYFGIGDCTGHGVPGAFIASMSIEALRSVLKQRAGQTPDVILDALRNSSSMRFKTTENGLVDSMDAAMCMYDKLEQKMYFAGGFMNLFLIRNNEEITEYVGTKCPIGFYPIEICFNLETIEIKKNDTIIMSSDGYLDQFGFDGKREKSSKFMRKRFKSFLLEICHLPSQEQIKRLKSKHLEWKKDLHQTDDISVMIVNF